MGKGRVRKEGGFEPSTSPLAKWSALPLSYTRRIIFLENFLRKRFIKPQFQQTIQQNEYRSDPIK